MEMRRGVVVVVAAVAAHAGSFLSRKGAAELMVSVNAGVGELERVRGNERRLRGLTPLGCERVAQRGDGGGW